MNTIDEAMEAADVDDEVMYMGLFGYTLEDAGKRQLLPQHQQGSFNNAKIMCPASTACAETVKVVEDLTTMAPTKLTCTASNPCEYVTPEVGLGIATALIKMHLELDHAAEETIKAVEEVTQKIGSKSARRRQRVRYARIRQHLYKQGGEDPHQLHYKQGEEVPDQLRYEQGGETPDQPQYKQGGEAPDHLRYEKGGDVPDNLHYEQDGEVPDLLHYKKGGEAPDQQGREVPDPQAVGGEVHQALAQQEVPDQHHYQQGAEGPTQHWRHGEEGLIQHQEGEVVPDPQAVVEEVPQALARQEVQVLEEAHNPVDPQAAARVEAPPAVHDKPDHAADAEPAVHHDLGAEEEEQVQPAVDEPEPDPDDNGAERVADHTAHPVKKKQVLGKEAEARDPADLVLEDSPDEAVKTAHPVKKK